MKIKNLLLILIVSITFFACKKDDIHDPVKQASIDDAALIEYLQTHYLNEDNDDILTIDNGQSSLYNDERLAFDEIKENDIDYKLYYLIEKEGVDNVYPKVTDSVLVTYSGTKLDGAVFDSAKAITWLSLKGVIKGWSYGFTHFTGGNKVINSSDESFYFENFGEGFLFIPSGLAYGNTTSQTGALSNQSLVFKITLQAVKPVSE